MSSQRFRNRRRPPDKVARSIPKLTTVLQHDCEELREKIQRAHDLEHSSDFVNRILTDTVACGRVMSDPMYLYKRSLGKQLNGVHSVQRSLHRLPRNLIGVVHEDIARGFNGVFSKLGNYFLASFQDRTLKLYSSMDPLQMRLLSTRAAENVQWSVLDIAFSPDERHVAYSGWVEKIYLMDILNEDTPVREIAMRDGDQAFMCAFSVKFDASGREILAGGYEGAIFLGDVETGARICYIERGHALDINALAFADSGGHVFVSGGDDAVLRVFDRRTLRSGDPVPVGLFVGHTCGVTYIDSKDDSRYLLSNSKDQTIRLWDMRRMGAASSFPRTFETLMRRSSFHWDYRYRGMPPQFLGHGNEPPLDADHSLLILRGHEVRQTLIRARFSPALTTGQRYAYAGGSRGCWYLWDLLTGEIASMDVRCGHGNAVVRDVFWHPSEPAVLTTDFVGSVKCFHYRSFRAEMEADQVESEGKVGNLEPLGSSRFALNFCSTSPSEEEMLSD